jgi:hypothetical protein
MAIEGITAAGSGIQQSCQDTEQDQISELVRLEQDVQKLKSDYKDQAKGNGISQIEINSKIRKYEKLISKIELEIRQLKKKMSSKPVEQEKGRKSDDIYRRGRDSAASAIAALKASYRMLFSPSDPTMQETENSGEADVSALADSSKLNDLV